MTNPVPAAPRPRGLQHGTIGAWNTGCRCGSCVGVAQAVAAMPAPTTKPDRLAKRRAGRGWVVRVEKSGADIQTGQSDPRMRLRHVLMDGEVMAYWSGVTGVLICTEKTWRLIETDDTAITAMQEAQEEAKVKMPRSVVRDVLLAGTLGPARPPDPPVSRRQPKRASSGIRELNAQIKTLVEEMTHFDSPTPVQQSEFARRYGALRDRIATLRREFSEAEGMFEVAQTRIVAFMDQED